MASLSRSANFAPTEAPITMSPDGIQPIGSFAGYFGYKAKWWAYGFLNHLSNKDWVAFKTFDLKTHLLDGLHAEQANEVGARHCVPVFPRFQRIQLCLTLILETLDQLRDVHGKKSIVLLATGIDTFSKHTLDQTLKRLKETDVTIFCVGMGEDIGPLQP